MAKPSSDEPYAVMSARTGLWEAWVSNHPGPPGHLYLAKVSGVSNRWRAAKVPESRIPFPRQVDSVSFTSAPNRIRFARSVDATDSTKNKQFKPAVCATSAG